MISARGKTYARLIHAGRMTLEDVPEEWKEDTCDSWEYLYPDLPPLRGEE